MKEELTTHSGINNIFHDGIKKTGIADVIFKSLKADIPLASKKLLTMQFMWIWSEFSGKFIGCPNWSQDAVHYFENIVKNSKNDNEFFKKNGELRTDWARDKQININSDNVISDEKRQKRLKKPNLVHEHSIPKSFACEQLLVRSIEFKGAEEIFSFMESHAQGVVITEEERERLDKKHKSSTPDPENYTWLDRYTDKDVNIKVCKVNWAALSKDKNMEISNHIEGLNFSR